jgi:ethanolamine utilization protein EutQ (cupin superfamily)
MVGTKRFSRVTKLLVGLTCSLALSAGQLFAQETAKAEMHPQNAADMKPFVVGNQTVIMSETVSHPNMTAGVARFKKGDHTDCTYWWDEVIYSIKGSGKVTVSAPWFTESKSYILKPGDVMYLPKSTKVNFDGVNDEPWDVFYVTSPAP